MKSMFATIAGLLLSATAVNAQGINHGCQYGFTFNGCNAYPVTFAQAPCYQVPAASYPITFAYPTAYAPLALPAYPVATPAIAQPITYAAPICEVYGVGLAAPACGNCHCQAGFGTYGYGNFNYGFGAYGHRR